MLMPHARVILRHCLSPCHGLPDAADADGDDADADAAFALFPF